MPNAPKPMKGTGRVAFIAHRETIAAELEAGWPLKAVYQKLSAKLGISYAQFARYVDALIRNQDQPVAQRRRLTRALVRDPDQLSDPQARPDETTSAPSAASPTLAKPTPPATHERPIDDARHEPTARGKRAFNHDANEKPDDRKRLLGEE